MSRLHRVSLWSAWTLILFASGVQGIDDGSRSRTLVLGALDFGPEPSPAGFLQQPEAPGEVQVPTATLPIAALLVATVVLVIYGPRGWRVVTSVLIYLAALSSITLSVKWVLGTPFEFPKFISTCHFLVGLLTTGCILANRKRQGVSLPIPSAHEYWLLIFPIALAVVLSIGANNTALVFNSAAFTEIMGSTNSLMTMGIVSVLGMPPSPWLIPPAILVAFGCVVSTAGDIHCSALGVALCLAATFFRSLKVSLQQRLLTGKTRDRLDPVALLFWICIPSTLVMLLFSLITEGVAPYRQLLALSGEPLRDLCLKLGASCVNATILNVAQLYVTQDLGAVGSQLAAQTKMVLVVLGGMVLFEEVVTRVELLGFCLVIAGVFWFSRTEEQVKLLPPSPEKMALQPKGKGPQQESTKMV